MARQTFESEIWNKKPSSWFKIWIYILGKTNHKDKAGFKRGEHFFNFSQELRDIGVDITYNMVSHSLVYFRKSGMISTTKSTRGVVIKVLNYAKYQELDNYTSKTPSKIEAKQKQNRSETIHKNDKNEKNEKNKLATSKKEVAGVNDILDIFYQSINPTINFGNKTSRKSCEELIKRFTLLEVKRMTQQICDAQQQGDRFCPTATTPHQMKEKLAQFKIYFNNKTKTLRKII